MITTPEEYKWMSGDFDTSEPYPLIDGEIMPLRTGTNPEDIDRKKILRGEDVCFLAEAAKERSYCFNNSIVRDWDGSGYSMVTINVSEVPFPFSKSVSASQMQTLVGLYTDLFSRSSQAYPMGSRPQIFCIDKTKLQAKTIAYNANVYDELNTIWNNAAITSDIQTSTSSDFTTDGALEQAAVSKIFDDLSKLNTIVLHTIGYINADGLCVDVVGDTWTPAYRGNVGYHARNNSDNQGQFYWMPNFTWASIPETYFSGVEVWGCYTLIGRSFWHPNWVNIDYSFRKIADMTVENGKYVYHPTVAQAKALIEDRLRLIGETIHPYTSIPYGGLDAIQFYETYFPLGVWFVGTLSDRTRWLLSGQS